MRFTKSDYPAKPGVYLMKDKDGQVIYIGKASSIRTRLSSYFNGNIDPKTRLLVKHVASIDFVITKDPNEALVLESNLIKTHQPRYNMVLKDAKHFSYLSVTKEKFPRLLIARKNSKGQFKIKNASFYGPYVEGSKRAISARYLRKLFKIRICKRLPKKECLQYHIGNCDAPCIGKISEEEYSRNVETLCKVLEGKKGTKRLIGLLRDRMKEASRKQDYESAAALRDQIESLKIFFERQRVERVKHTDEDFVWFKRIGNLLYVQILRSRAGVIGKVEKHSMEIKNQENPEVSFVMQHYSELPDHIYSNMTEDEAKNLNRVLKTKAFKIPGREKKKVLEIAAKTLIEGRVDAAVLRLKEELDLESNPIVIETFDISTLFGEESVGSMVLFVNGKPDKNGYRRFKIRSVEGQDDFAMMKEIVTRRYKRLVGEGNMLPDLVLIDGGAAQLHAAMDAFSVSGVRLQVASIAKKEEEVYLPNRMETIRMKKNNPALKLLQRCRDEAHRFAISYHRLRRKKKSRE